MENKWIVRGKILYLYSKYQIITKGILALILMPCFSLISSFLIRSSGRTNISSGDYIQFFTGVYGFPLIIVGLLLLITVLGIDINTFVIISSLIEEKKLNIKGWVILKQALKSVKNFFSPIGVFIAVFVALIFPLLGVGISMSPFKNFKIPNFITSVIFANTLYSVLYYLLLTVLFVISILYIFTIHFILIEEVPVREALRSSRRLIKRHFKDFVIDSIFAGVKIFLIMFLVFVMSISLGVIATFGINFLYPNDSVVFIMIVLAILELLSLYAFLSVPIAISVLTRLFYKYRELDGKKPELQLIKETWEANENDLNKKISFKTKIKLASFVIILIVINFAVSLVFENNFEELFVSEIDIDLIAHRGGGDLGTENTVEGINAAIEAGAKWTEIDVQRTKDGHYIIHHDASFARLAGVNKTPMQLTLKEIRELVLKNEFENGAPTGKVATLEEVLDSSKGRIGVFVELKEKSADEKMVDDVVKMIKEKDMLDECVILSLDYKIIQYTASEYPEIKTGYLYFFSAGKLKDLTGDYLIMEEREATDANIDEIHLANKKVVVWTVNTKKSIKKFIDKDIDGIITDHVLLVKESIEEANKRSRLELIIDRLLQSD